MSREIRRVPANWQHPKQLNGKYESMSGDYIGSLEFLRDDISKLIEHVKNLRETGSVQVYDTVSFDDETELLKYFTEGMEVPDVSEYIPYGKWYQLYQTVSEGTPLSPAFETQEELVDWLSNNDDYWGERWTKKQAEKMVDVGYSPSGIITGGKMYNSREALEL